MKFSNDGIIPGVVVGSGLTTLGTIRCLGRLGIPAIGIFDTANDYPVRSRYCAIAKMRGKPDQNNSNLSTILQELDVEQAVLFPCTDLAVTEIAETLTQDDTNHSASMASLDCINRIADKGSLADIMQKLQLPHPRTVFIDRHTDLATLPYSADEGLFLKPRQSQKFSRIFGVKAFTINSRDDLLARVGQARDAGLDLFLQEYIPGPSNLHVFIDGFVNKQHKICTLFARNRLRMYPEDYGNSTCMVTIPLREVQQAADTITTLLEHSQYRGIFSAEFKYDNRDGLYKLIEVNTRPWWYIEFAESCGINVCDMAYRDALGQTVPRIDTYPVGRRFIYPVNDLAAGFKAYKRGQLSLPEWGKSWWRAKTPVFSWDDPVPALFSTVISTRDYIRNCISKNK